MFLLTGLIVNGLAQSYFLTNFPRIKFPGLKKPSIDLRNTYKRFYCLFFLVSVPILSHILLPKMDRKGKNELGNYNDI
jgi:hypothetical protein